MSAPAITPKLGFYYHYMHDDETPVNDNANEVLGLGMQSESTPNQEEVSFVFSRPLFESNVFRAGKYPDLQSLALWMGKVNDAGQIRPRFQLITDRRIISMLHRIKTAMYQNE